MLAFNLGEIISGRRKRHTDSFCGIVFFGFEEVLQRRSI